MKPSWLGSSLTCNVFSKSWFLCSGKSHIQKNGDVTACYFCTIKKQAKFQKHPDPTYLQDISSITDTFEEFYLRFPEHLFCRTHFSGCFLKLYYSYHVVFQWYFKTSKYIWICFCFFYLDTKSVVKINYGVPTHSATKLKKHKVQNWVNTDIFKHNFR